MDYRKVNERTTTDKYPIPNINDILDKLGRCQYFSTLDLASGFHQIEMHRDSIPKTAFTVEHGHYEYVRMPFGLKNAPATFQRVMDNILKELQNKICLVYMDDIIIFSTSLEEHIQNLKQVFAKLRETNLKIQLDKCEFLRKEVGFLGHIITPQGIKPNPQKIEAIQRFPIPKTAKEIKSFLGLLGYYRRFINNFAKLTKPLTKCLKKDTKIIHDEEFIKTFDLCKSILTNDPILKYPDFSKPFVLTTDASNFAIGAVLSQGQIGSDLPVAYASRTLNPAECNYSTIDKELLAVVWATKYFRPYLFGRKFTIVCDHKPLEWLMSSKDQTSRLVRWRLKLEEYDYTIVYKKGKMNTNADALSRIELHNTETESIIANPSDSDQEEIANELEKCIRNKPEEISQEEIDEVLDELLALPQSSKQIRILDNIQIKPPDTNATVHTAIEHPVFEIPITERPLNQYNNQIVIKTNNTDQTFTLSYKIFPTKERHTLSISNNKFETELIKYLKTKINPQQSYALYFDDENTMINTTNTIQKHFKVNSLKLVHCTKFLLDVIDPNEQNLKIQYVHETKTCHRGINETTQLLTKNYYWPNLTNMVKDYINRCEICQTGKYDRNPPKIKFQSTPSYSKPFETLHLDTFRINNRHFLTIIDAFSKYGQAYPIDSVININVMNNILTYLSHHGVPQTIIVDQGNEFKNLLLDEFCKIHKIILHYTTVRNSNSNSPVERFHSTLSDSIRCLLQQYPNDHIDLLMKYAIMGYNNSIHSSTKFSPFEVVYGNTDKVLEITEHDVVNEFSNKHKNLLKIIHDKVKTNNEKKKLEIISKINEDRESPIEYKENETVYIKQLPRKAKHSPKFIKSKAIKNKDIKLDTTNGTLHKKFIKKPRELIQSQPLQDENHPHSGNRPPDLPQNSQSGN